MLLLCVDFKSTAVLIWCFHVFSCLFIFGISCCSKFIQLNMAWTYPNMAIFNTYGPYMTLEHIHTWLHVQYKHTIHYMNISILVMAASYLQQWDDWTISVEEGLFLLALSCFAGKNFFLPPRNFFFLSLLKKTVLPVQLGAAASSLPSSLISLAYNVDHELVFQPPRKIYFLSGIWLCKLMQVMNLCPFLSLTFPVFGHVPFTPLLYVLRKTRH